jgi:hypothetical protein
MEAISCATHKPMFRGREREREGRKERKEEKGGKGYDVFGLRTFKVSSK